MSAKLEKKFKIDFCVVCEEIRREVNRKVTLVGAYTNDILVKEFPAKFPISFWTVGSANRSGEHEIELRLASRPTHKKVKKEIVKFDVSFKVEDPNQRFGLGSPRINLLFKEEEIVGIQYRLPGGRWKEVTTFEVRKAGDDVVFA